MREVIEKLRRASRNLLENEEVDQVLAWRRGRFFWQGAPRFVSEPEEVDELSYLPAARANLAKYLVDVARGEQPGGPGEEDEEKTVVAVWSRGCEARAINRLINDEVIERDMVKILGFHCPGTIDTDELLERLEVAPEEVDSVAWDSPDELLVETAAGEQRLATQKILSSRCRHCTHPEPVMFDELFGEESREPACEPKRFADIEKLEQLQLEERYDFWSEHFDRCIRCYACRNVCPACNCVECVFDSALPQQPDWLGKGSSLSEKAQFHLVRMFHVAGRCIECGECERVCPVNVPVRQLMVKAAADIDELFGPYEAGLVPDETPPLQTYELDDPKVHSEGGDN